MRVRLCSFKIDYVCQWCEYFLISLETGGSVSKDFIPAAICHGLLGSPEKTILRCLILTKNWLLICVIINKIILNF